MAAFRSRSLADLSWHLVTTGCTALVLALGFTVIGAGLFTLTRTGHHRVPQEALIGIVYVVTAGLGILLLSRSPEGNEELRRTLIGEVLLVTPAQVLRTFGLYVVIAAVHIQFRKKFLMISFTPAEAEASGISIRGWNFLFYALFGWVVTSFVQIGGVLLVFSFLIVPAVCANFLANSLRAKLLLGWVTATLASMAGLYISYEMDLPTGAAIVCTLGVALIVAMIAARFRKPPAGLRPCERLHLSGPVVCPPGRTRKRTPRLRSDRRTGA